MATWFDKLWMFGTKIVDEARTKPGLTVFATDHKNTPITVNCFAGKCFAGESDA